MLVMQKRCDKRWGKKWVLVFLAWGLFLIALFIPCLYIPPFVADRANDTWGVELLWLTPLLALVFILGSIANFELWSIVFAIQLIVHTLGNMLLLFSPLGAIFRVKRQGFRVTCFVIVSICTLSAFSLLLSHDDLDVDLLRGYYIWCALHVALLGAAWFSIYKSRRAR
jgi:ABC-type multidrug transport system permease subunit